MASSHVVKCDCCGQTAEKRHAFSTDLPLYWVTVMINRGKELEGVAKVADKHECYDFCCLTCLADYLLKLQSPLSYRAQLIEAIMEKP